MDVEKLKNEMNDAPHDPGRGQLLHHADQGQDRHARHGHQDARRHQGPRAEARRDRDRSGCEVENAVKAIPGHEERLCRAGDHGLFPGFHVKREEVARYGLTVEDVQEVIESAIGGMNLTTTIEGRERYPVNVATRRELQGRYRQTEAGPRAGDVSGRSAPGAGMGAAAVRLGIARRSRSGRACRHQDRERADRHQERGGAAGSLCVHRFFRAGCGRLCEEAKKRSLHVKMPEGYRLAVERRV